MASISVVIPALNEEKYLPSLLRSLAEQTQDNFGVVVVDGSSKDGTVQVARAFSSSLCDLKVIVSPRAGVSRQRNLGARAARGEWLVFLDADNTVPPYFMERLDRFIEEQQPEFFTAWAAPDSQVAGDALLTLVMNLVVEGGLMAHRPVAPGALIAVRRDVFDRAGGFDEALTFAEDYDLTQRIIASGAQLQVLRETAYVVSLRRARKEGWLRFSLFYARAILRVLITKKGPRHTPNYVTGGQLFDGTPAPEARSPALGR